MLRIPHCLDNRLTDALTTTLPRGKSEGKVPLGRPRRSWADNIEMELRVTELAGMDCTVLRVGTSGGLF
jgi:hypothetical protein